MAPDRRVDPCPSPGSGPESLWLGNQAVPSDFAELCARVDRVEGVHFGVWFPEPGSGDQTLAEVLDLARAVPDEQLYREILAQWDRSSPR